MATANLDGDVVAQFWADEENAEKAVAIDRHVQRIAGRLQVFLDVQVAIEEACDHGALGRAGAVAGRR